MATTNTLAVLCGKRGEDHQFVEFVLCEGTNEYFKIYGLLLTFIDFTSQQLGKCKIYSHPINIFIYAYLSLLLCIHLYIIHISIIFQFSPLV